MGAGVGVAATLVIADGAGTDVLDALATALPVVEGAANAAGGASEGAGSPRPWQAGKAVNKSQIRKRCARMRRL